MRESYFITGIGTGIGKTLVSAVLTEKLQADYWKPVQSGDLDNSDSQTVRALLSNPYSVIHPETYRLNTAMSPHASAKIDGIEIDLNNFSLPDSPRTLLVEGAGGLMVPLNGRDMIIDLIKKLNIPVIVVSQNYLGSINHSLLTLDMLKQHQIPVKGIIFNGESNGETEKFILNHTGATNLGKIPELKTINKASIIEAGKELLIS